MSDKRKKLKGYYKELSCPYCRQLNPVLIDCEITEAEEYALDHGLPYYLILKNLTLAERLAITTGEHEDCNYYANISTL